MACFGRPLDSPCTLALLVGFQFAFVVYFSLGGFRGLVSVLVHSADSEFDYAHPHDVYTNLSHLGALLTSHTGAPGKGEQLRDCHSPSPLLVGPVSVRLSSPLTLEEIREKNPLVTLGGRYRPPDCEPHHHTAIVVPYRNRQAHLRSLLYHLHPFLQRQQLHYSIYIVHQMGNSTFNRAKLLNVGVREALRDEDWSCLFLHDVDLLPENDHNSYTCHPKYPTHLSVAMDKFHYRLPYSQYFGGVSAVTPDQYLRMNGFPNQYWGWGGEDDDIAASLSPELYSVCRRGLRSMLIWCWYSAGSQSTRRVTRVCDGMRSIVSIKTLPPRVTLQPIMCRLARLLSTVFTGAFRISARPWIDSNCMFCLGN
ncbi:beta-1,4-galactosyltransferase 3 isoform X2 [Anguilla rostrata]|uniref:beta-1,4-galactosyltransferase 3 isoform X2 n=1 Tax=Anguilla rostrata TaxID=7938 RepID=UPI0030CB2FF1